jgi:hypothetical protein
LSIINFVLRGVYSFDVFPAALLGTDYKNVTVLAIMDAATANREIDIQALHAQIYPMLPVGTPNDPYGYDYVKIKTTAGNVTILGIAWINDTTVTLVQSNTITAVIGNVSAVDVLRIRNALIQNGYNNIALSIV